MKAIPRKKHFGVDPSLAFFPDIPPEEVDACSASQVSETNEQPDKSGSGNEDSLSEDTDSQLCLSDDEDVFEMRACVEKDLSHRYKKSFLYVNSRAIAQVADMLRADPLLPYSDLLRSPFSDGHMSVDEPLLWPSWHCPFKNCNAHGFCKPKEEVGSETQKHILPRRNHAKELWSHVWGAEDLSQVGKHRYDLSAVVRVHLSPYLKLTGDEGIKEWAFSLLQEAIAMKCREGMEAVGLARDRRSLSHVEEVFTEPNCKVLMCFVCNTKHIYYHNFDKYGNEYNAGRIDYRNKAEDRKVLMRLIPSNHEEKSFFATNLCAKRFRMNYAAAIEKDPHGVRETSNE